MEGWPVVGRFAPSPTGYLHIGNLWIAMLSYISVRQQGGHYILRIEDIDQSRARPEFETALVEDLLWMGFSWEVGPGVSSDSSVYRQSERMALYETYWKRWQKEKRVYPCFCNRARLQKIAAAPHHGEARPTYDGRCRLLSEVEYIQKSREKSPAWRLYTRPRDIQFQDRWQGYQQVSLCEPYDDIILCRGESQFAYQWVVSIDDAVQGVTEVIRGYDLLTSTPWQIDIQETLGFMPAQYAHAPLLMDRSGHRLSKRQQGITLRELRSMGWTPDRILATLCKDTGLLSHAYDRVSLAELCEMPDVLECVRGQFLTLTSFDIVI